MKQYLNKEFLLSHKQIIIKVAAILGILAVAFFVFVLGGGEEKTVSPPVQQASVSGGAGEGTEAELMIVDIGGAVQTPQVAELKADSRVADAIAAAGGLKENADLSGINQAAFLTDGEKIYIPAKGEAAAAMESIPNGQNASASSDPKVNINTAASEELQALNGVGPATAEKIIDYRKNNGYFKSIEDLKNVSGIGDKTFEKLKAHIKV